MQPLVLLIDRPPLKTTSVDAADALVEAVIAKTRVINGNRVCNRRDGEFDVDILPSPRARTHKVVGVSGVL